MTETENLPNLIIIGAMKCGTTSLHHYLNLHPEICMSRDKELDFFIEEKNWSRGIKWYKSHFVGQAKIYGESSPNYTRYPIWKGIPLRMFSVIPETKLIYIVRNPIERIISHYVHLYADSKENRDIEEALAELDGNQYIERSKYFLQLEQYLEFFSDSNILIITSEELSNFPQKTLKKVFQFLQVDADFEFKFKINNITELLKFGPIITSSSFKFNTKLHQSSIKTRKKISVDSPITTTLSKITALLSPEIRCHIEKIIYRPFSQKIERPKINDTLRERLREYLTEDISKLKEYTRYEFKEWNL
ncbi:MAG: sulfotransferase domain-containing protein [Cyanobacteria bacterium P01_D01_bin.50]